MNALQRPLFAIFLVGAGLLAAPAAFAQRTDSTSTVKPQLNTAPPGAAPRPVPAPNTPAPRHEVPVPLRPPVNEPIPARPSTDSPSGLELPSRPGVAAPPPPLRKYFLYTNFGLGYSSNPYEGGQFSVSLSPAIGYRVTEKFALGPGISYAYNNISFPDNYQAAGSPNSLSLHSLGFKGFMQYIVYKEFFIHAEYEVTKAQSYNVYQVGPQQVEVVKINRTMNTPLLGAGYRSQISQRAAFDIVALYNFNNGYDSQGYQLSPYGQPVIRFSFLYDIK